MLLLLAWLAAFDTVTEGYRLSLIWFILSKKQIDFLRVERPQSWVTYTPQQAEIGSALQVRNQTLVKLFTLLVLPSAGRKDGDGESGVQAE